MSAPFFPAVGIPALSLDGSIIGSQWHDRYPRSTNPRGYFMELAQQANRFDEGNRERLDAELCHSGRRLSQMRITDTPGRDCMVAGPCHDSLPLRHPPESARPGRAPSYGVRAPDPTETRGPALCIRVETVGLFQAGGSAHGLGGIAGGTLPVRPVHAS